MLFQQKFVLLLDFSCFIYFFQKRFKTVFSWRDLKHQTRLESSYYSVSVNDKRHRCSLILSLFLSFTWSDRQRCTYSHTDKRRHTHRHLFSPPSYIYIKEHKCPRPYTSAMGKNDKNLEWFVVLTWPCTLKMNLRPNRCKMGLLLSRQRRSDLVKTRWACFKWRTKQGRPSDTRSALVARFQI